MCVCDGVDWCALNQDCTALGYAQQTCPKWSIKCPYDTSFVKCIDCPPSFNEECKGTGEVGEGQSCEGKYQSCTCDSSYQYTCTGTGESGTGAPCGGKYQSCTCTSPYTWSNGACSCPSTYKYTCTGTGYSGGSGTACGGKYAACTCASGYEWKDGSCQISNPCYNQGNGAYSEVYCCNGTVVGVKASGMSFYVAMQDLGRMNWSNANSQCRNYSFCGYVKGTLPTLDQLKSIYQNKSRVNSLLSTNGGTQLTNDYYWSSIREDNYDPYNKYYYLMDMSDGGTNFNLYHSNDYVRPVLASW